MVLNTSPPSDVNTKCHPELGLMTDGRKKVCSHNNGSTMVALKEDGVHLVAGLSQCLKNPTVGWFPFTAVVYILQELRQKKKKKEGDSWEQYRMQNGDKRKTKPQHVCT